MSGIKARFDETLIIILIYSHSGASIMELVSTTRDRIFAAADTLYEEGGRTDFPTVDAVRKSARVNMNDANTGMKEWRRLQMVRAAPVAVHVPEAVQQASNAALSVLWKTAQGLANESLDVAQAGWERDRVEADTLNRQLADAYEAQSAELVTAQSETVRLASEVSSARAAVELLESTLASKNTELREAKGAAERSEVRCVEIERRAEDLRIELNHAHEQVGVERAELATIVTAHAAEIDELRSALVTAKSKNESAVELARNQVNQLREENASLRGQIQTMTEQFSTIAREPDRKSPSPGARR